jgi:hypothetical protein
MAFEIFTPRINHLQPFEDKVSFDGTDATVGSVAAGSSRKIELRTYRGVKIVGAELHINKWNTVTAASTNFGLNLYCSYKTPDNVAETAKALTAPIQTNSTTAIAQGGGDIVIPLIVDHLVDPTTATDLAASNGFGTFTTGKFDSTQGTSFGNPIINPLGHRFQEISFGIEISGGEDTKGIVCAGQLSVYGFMNGMDMPQVASGKASFASWGDDVTYSPTTGGWVGTLAASATDDLDAIASTTV